MTALAALVLLASSTVRAEDLFAPGTMICTCAPATSAATAAPVAAEEAPAPSWRTGRLGLYSAATTLALFGGSFAAHLRSNGDFTLQGGDNGWHTASTTLLIGGAAMAGFTAALFAFRF